MWKTARAAAMVVALLAGTAAIGYAQTRSTPGTGGSAAGDTPSTLGTRGSSPGAATDNPSSSGASMGTSGSSATAPGMEERSEQGLSGPEKRAKHRPVQPMDQGPGQR